MPETQEELIRGIAGGDRLATKAVLRAQILRELKRSGFVQADDGLLALPEMNGNTKEVVRGLHQVHRESVLTKNLRFLDKWEDKLIDEFADGTEVDPAAIAPELVPVQSTRERALFRLATLHWSVPVSHGYGRRTSFLVRDGSNGKLLGVFALGDPVFNLKVRDDLIGWNQEQRKARLYNVFDAYVLGAVEPYRQLIGGKLVALCALADEVADVLIEKYTGTTTEISKETKNPAPILVTTTSSLGRSSVYNRLKYRDRWAFRSIGFTRGFGHFHFSDELFDRIVAYLQEEGYSLRGHQYGDGPNWRIRTLRGGLQALGLNGDLLRHGIQREVFVAPRALGWRGYLRGETDHVHWTGFPLDDLSAWWRERWGVPRADRDDRYLAHRRDSMRLTPGLETS